MQHWKESIPGGLEAGGTGAEEGLEGGGLSEVIG